MGAVRFFLSASEANDAALSLAQAITGRKPIATRERAYHGFAGLSRAPDLLEDAVADEPLKPAVDGRVRAEAARQLIPLHDGAQAVDDPVDDHPQVGVGGGRSGRAGSGG